MCPGDKPDPDPCRNRAGSGICRIERIGAISICHLLNNSANHSGLRAFFPGPVAKLGDGAASGPDETCAARAEIQRYLHPHGQLPTLVSTMDRRIPGHSPDIAMLKDKRCIRPNNTYTRLSSQFGISCIVR